MPSNQVENEYFPDPIAESKQLRLDRWLFVVVCSILVIVSLLMLSSLVFQATDYREGIRIASDPKTPDHSAIIAYARSLDIAVVKTSGVFLGFLLVFVGVLYVLRQSSTAYALHGRAGSLSGGLTSSSPGLVLATLGVVLILGAMFNKGMVDYAPAFQYNSSPAASKVGPPSVEYEKLPI